MSQALDQLRELLTHVFHLDHAELDVGRHRIMHAEREEIRRFLGSDLPGRVRALLRGTGIASARENERGLGARRADPAAREQEVYALVHGFFRRCYQDGDSPTRRREAAGAYAPPWGSDGAGLRWANADRYYVTTRDRLRQYTFTVASGRCVHFGLEQAGACEDHCRASRGGEGRFMLARGRPLAEDHGDLWIRFRYAPDPKRRRQSELNALTVRRILSETDRHPRWRGALASSSPAEKPAGRTLLERHLAAYTARNPFDYFIHKDLGAVLRRALDRYIKDEVVRLDDIDGRGAPRAAPDWVVVRAVRRAARDIIDRLARVADFERRLWLKKKFVVETHYCVTLDRVPARLYREIAANDAQRREWARLFAIDRRRGRGAGHPGYSVPLAVEFLRAHPHLVLDTRHFSAAFKSALVASMDRLDANCDGALVHSDNLQALNLMAERYRARVKCVYIDPPYNTGSDEFAYRDDYRRSSWLAMLADRLAAARAWLRDDGVVFISIDAHERDRLKGLADSVFGEAAYLNTFVWVNNLKGRQIAGRGAARTHEYVLAYGGPGAGGLSIPVGRAKAIMPSAYKGFDYEPRRDARGPYVLKNELHNTNSKFNEATRGNLVFNIHWNPATGAIRFSPADADVAFGGFVKIPPKRNRDGVHRYHAWRWSREKILRERHDLEFVRTAGGVRIFTKVRDYDTTGLKDLITDIPTDAGSREIAASLGATPFRGHPKPVRLVEIFAGAADAGEVVLDFFAGSGTTACAVLALMREDGRRRQYVLVEAGGFFDTVLVPRVKTAVYAEAWKGGRPVAHDGGVSHAFKYVRLESYEDTLNNLVPRGPLGRPPAHRDGRELRYVLDADRRDGASLLSIDCFRDPFRCHLNILGAAAGRPAPTVVDLVETFNYLLGLTVDTIRDVDGVRAVVGTDPRGKRVLVLWRRLEEVSDRAVEAWLSAHALNPSGGRYDVVYVNGEGALAPLRRRDRGWSLRRIEDEFLRLMFQPHAPGGLGSRGGRGVRRGHR